MNEKLCEFFSKMALAMLLVNLVMLLFVEPGSAEQVVTVLSIVMMAVLFAVSTAWLRKQFNQSGTTAQENKEKENNNENQN